MTARPPYLVPVPADATVAELWRGALGMPAPSPVLPRPRLTAWQRAEIEGARCLVMQTGDLLDTKPHAYVAGLLEGAAANLLDILDAIAEPGGES